MSFNLYFAGSQHKIVENYFIEKKVCRLVSQLNERRVIQQYAEIPDEARPTLFVDSGAFSVANSNKKVDIDDYIEYINKMDDTVDYWAELDVISYFVVSLKAVQHSSEESWKNYLYMLDKVKSPHKILPIYHFSEPIEHLQKILNTPVIDGKPADYIGIGGIAGITTETQIRYFTKVFNVIKNSNNPNVKVHALGVTATRVLESFPFYSSDSTSWLQTGVNGGILTSYGRYSISDRCQYEKDSFHQLDPYTKQKVEQEIIDKGYTVEGLATEYIKRCLFNIDYFLDWAKNYKYRPITSSKKSLIN